MPNFISNSNNRQYSADRWTSRVLRLGVWISASFMVLGLLLAAIFPSSIVPLSTNPSLGTLVEYLFSTTFDPVTLMFAGIVLLMFTPILRVFTAMFGFGVERDWRFVFVSSLVLILLAGEIVYSILIKG